MSDSPVLRRPTLFTERYDTHVVNAWAQASVFRSGLPHSAELPSFGPARAVLPDPFWEGHAATIACYWRAWELAFSNLKQAGAQNGFSANYCDTAFNGNLFLWDSSFVTCFGVYGRRAFDFQRTLDNFYRKQHADGFICREIAEVDGQDCFQRFDPSGTGPNVLAWAEWNHFVHTGDWRRLEIVFAPLVAYHQWLRMYQTWPDGSYWSTGWGSGMDNLPRVSSNDHPYWGHGHITWVDATFQALLSATVLLRMAAQLGRQAEVEDLRAEAARLSEYANQRLWNRQAGFYYDRFADGALSTVKHIGAYWALLAGCTPPEDLAAFVAHLENPGEFNRVHRVPALSADDPGYSPDGGYWCGGVWAPTNYMVIKGLEAVGCRDLAHQIATNHLENVVRVFESDEFRWHGAEQFRAFFHLDQLDFDDRHTLWENYAPEAAAPGGHAKPGYVGWTGIPPIAGLLEGVFGLSPDAPANRLTWNVRLMEEHGVRRYPFGANGSLDLRCHSRGSRLERPVIEIRSNIPLTLELIWEGGRETLNITRAP